MDVLQRSGSAEFVVILENMLKLPGFGQVPAKYAYAIVQDVLHFWDSAAAIRVKGMWDHKLENCVKWYANLVARDAAAKTDNSYKPDLQDESYYKYLNVQVWVDLAKMVQKNYMPF